MKTAFHKSVPNAEESPLRLMPGNERFRNGPSHWSQVPYETLFDLDKGQHSFATNFSCRTSRMPPEPIFNVGRGQPVIIRVAGDAISSEFAESRHYARTQMQTQLVVVLRREGFGSVRAELATKNEYSPHRTRIRLLVIRILSRLPDFESGRVSDKRHERDVESSLLYILQQFMGTPEAPKHSLESRMEPGAVCEIESGRERPLP